LRRQEKKHRAWVEKMDLELGWRRVVRWARGGKPPTGKTKWYVREALKQMRINVVGNARPSREV